MIILGLGSNKGDRLSYLRKALAAIETIPSLSVTHISPVYFSDALLNDRASAAWNLPFLNVAIRCETSLSSADCLNKLKHIEIALGREKNHAPWSPRVIDIDILVWDDKVIDETALKIPHAGLLERPFALWPLADIAPEWIYPNMGKTAAQLVEKWGSRFTGEAPLHTRQIQQRITQPELVGIINVTPDSFSDGNQYVMVEKGMSQALHLVNSGASVIDIGAESTAPHAAVIDAETEWQRLSPLLETLLAAKEQFLIPPKISIDTRHAKVARKALDKGVDWINDVTGLKDPRMREIVLSSKADCVIMHHLSIPANQTDVLPRESDPVSLVYQWGMKTLDELEKAGMKRERIIFDPGIGFGKTAEHSLALIKNIKTFHGLGTRLLVGHSRKSFMGLFSASSAQERDIETMVMTLHLGKEQVDYVRVHQVEMCARGLKTLSFL